MFCAGDKEEVEKSGRGGGGSEGCREAEKFKMLPAIYYSSVEQ
jgi:hypothetical protein